jgi:hypothetical protein
MALAQSQQAWAGSSKPGSQLLSGKEYQLEARVDYCGEASAEFMAEVFTRPWLEAEKANPKNATPEVLKVLRKMILQGLEKSEASFILRLTAKRQKIGAKISEPKEGLKYPYSLFQPRAQGFSCKEIPEGSVRHFHVDERPCKDEKELGKCRFRPVARIITQAEFEAIGKSSSPR